jgi:probable addiction module antidote protein
MEPTESPDATGYFGTEDDVVDYLNLWMEDGSPREIARALGDVARSKGITEVFLRTGNALEPLYPALAGDGNPTLELLCAVLDALGLELSVKKKGGLAPWCTPAA